MKNIAIISSGSTLPIPPVKGGAVENLINFILNENECKKELNITVFSIYDQDALNQSKSLNNSSFEYIKVNDSLKKAGQITSRVINKLIKKDLDFDNQYINKVCKFLQNRNFDYVVVENRSPFVIPVKKSTKAKIILHLHNDYLNLNTKQGKEIINSCYKVLTVSQYVKNRVLTLGDKYNDKIQVLKNCTDINSFDKNKYVKFREKFRSDNQISNEDVVIMFSGRIHPTKGIKELIKAFLEIKNKNCKLLVVGSSWYGNDNKTEFVKEIEELSNFIHDKIIFTGYVAFTEMPKIHSVADIAVVPSIWDDPAPLVVFEAMASGLPLIVTNSGGIPEYVDKDSVIMLNRDQKLIENLTHSIDELVKDKIKRKKMGEAARKHAIKYNIEQYYKDFVEVIIDERTSN